MMADYRHDAARYYDLGRAVDDIPLYRQRIPSPEASILELGCGTGRVIVPLGRSCGYIHGVDQSEAMLAICHKKLAEATIPLNKARVQLGDITGVHLGRTFDLIIAPFRVMQNLETDVEVDGLFRTVREHLALQGTCILNVFRPYRDPASLRKEWCTDGEHFAWEVPFEGGRVTCHDRRPRMDKEKLVLYPELVYRYYEGDELVDEAVLKIVMRCYYPQEFVQLIVGHGFRVLNRWGGYHGEPYGQGPELVVEFAMRDP